MNTENEHTERTYDSLQLHSYEYGDGTFRLVIYGNAKAATKLNRLLKQWPADASFTDDDEPLFAVGRAQLFQSLKLVLGRPGAQSALAALVPAKEFNATMAASA